MTPCSRTAGGGGGGGVADSELTENMSCLVSQCGARLPGPARHGPAVSLRQRSAAPWAKNEREGGGGL